MLGVRAAEKGLEGMCGEHRVYRISLLMVKKCRFDGEKRRKIVILGPYFPRGGKKVPF